MAGVLRWLVIEMTGVTKHPKPTGRFSTLAVVAAVAAAACDPIPVNTPPDTSVPSPEVLLSRRPYAVVQPPQYAEGVGGVYPLVLVLHGYGGRAIDTYRNMGLSKVQPDAGFFVALPAGLPDGRGIAAWHALGPHYPEFDVEYLTAVIHDMESKYPIDRSRVIVAGHSQGAHMTHRMGCDVEDDVTALFALAGQSPQDPLDCKPSKPVTVVHVHGTEDTSIGYYGDVQGNDTRVPSALETVNVWRRNNRCRNPLDGGLWLDYTTLEGDETEIAAFACPAGVDVELWTVDGGSHNPEFNANFGPAVWKYLYDHPRSP